MKKEQQIIHKDLYEGFIHFDLTNSLGSRETENRTLTCRIETKAGEDHHMELKTIFYIPPDYDVSGFLQQQILELFKLKDEWKPVKTKEKK